MRRLLSLVVLGISSGIALNAQQPSNAELALRISAPQSTVKVGSDVYIKIEMTNISDHPVDCSSYIVSGTDRRFRVDVIDADDNSMKKKDIHPEMAPGSFASCMLDPGQSVSRDDRISWANDLTRPGVYTIQVARVVGRDEKNGLVKSNKITVTVKP
jgi:hypothetical protein